MIRRYLPGLAIAPVLLSLFAAPAAAQDETQGPQDQGERVNQLIIYGDDPCPPSTATQITVCARKSESERFRIPEILRESDDPRNVAWTTKVESYETVGDFGTLSCSPSGYGGWAGCTNQLIDAAYADKAKSSDVRFSELIAEERAKRLSTIDADAAAEQKRVEAEEKAYDERQAAEAQAQQQAASGDSGNQ